MRAWNPMASARDGTTHIVISPLEWMQRLTALVPRPRMHLIRYQGVLAPNAKRRSHIVPAAPIPDSNAADSADEEKKTGHYIHWARLLKRVFGLDLEHCPSCGGPLTTAGMPEVGQRRSSCRRSSRRSNNPMPFTKFSRTWACKRIRRHAPRRATTPSKKPISFHRPQCSTHRFTRQLLPALLYLLHPWSRETVRPGSDYGR